MTNSHAAPESSPFDEILEDPELLKFSRSFEPPKIRIGTIGRNELVTWQDAAGPIALKVIISYVLYLILVQITQAIPKNAESEEGATPKAAFYSVMSFIFILFINYLDDAILKDSLPYIGINFNALFSNNSGSLAQHAIAVIVDFLAKKHDYNCHEKFEDTHICPITLVPMTQPVIYNAPNGHNFYFELSALKTWLLHSKNNPSTNVKFDDAFLQKFKDDPQSCIDTALQKEIQERTVRIWHEARVGTEPAVAAP